MLKRIIALSVIFSCSWVAWAVLSAVTSMRTSELSESNRGDVSQLWGSEHTQLAPVVSIAWWEDVRRPLTDDEKAAYVAKKQEQENAEAAAKGRAPRVYVPMPEELYTLSREQKQQAVGLDSTDLRADLVVDHRKKGLLWFSTYSVGFASRYSFTNPREETVDVRVSVPFPSPSAVYDNMKLELDGGPLAEEQVQAKTEAGQMVALLRLPPKTSKAFRFGYQSRGLDRWSYRFAAGTEVTKVDNLHAVVRTSFDAIDFPPGSISPDRKTPRPAGGYELTWEKDSLVSGLEIGMLMPRRLNPGPLAAALSLHAPVSLFFFFFVMFMLQALRDIRMHPMNYFFLAASFFSFNLLFAYLVDHLTLPLSFAIASVVSMLLVVSYMRLVVGARFAVFAAGTSQIVYQVLFGVAHFFEGYTGLTITVGAILTLAVVMHATGGLDWEELFRKKSAATVAPTITP
ncbi:MAG: inner membrane CreD family protein [Myxococcota bacterium]|jgi:hypothetical protein|nr:inner membrane CreD family protein [Myxococcota bacterium]